MRLAIGLTIFLSAVLLRGADPQPDRVAGNLIMLNDNAGWCWYQDERILYDPVAGRILASTIANAAGFNGEPREADVDVTSFDPSTGQRLRVTMGKRNSYDSGDDHNVGALWIRPDGNYLHVWTGHNESSRNGFFRISTRPHDAGQWKPEQTFNWPGIGNPDKGKQHSATYNNLHYMADERDGRGRLYDITRESQRSPNIAYSDDLGETWHYGGKLTLTRSRSSYSNGYLKFSSNGRNRIDFITTEHHPRNYNTSIYHGYIQGGKSHNSHGEVIDDNIFDEKAPAPEDFTPVFQAAAEDGVDDNREFHRAWTIELERDPHDNLYALFSTRYGTEVADHTPGEADHRLFYARFDGQDWHHSEIAKMGGPLWKAEEDYVGLATIQPDNPNLIYVSTNHDPRSDTRSPRREVYRGETVDQGRSWSWTAITMQSTVDNLRPAIPRWDARHTAVCWLRGQYDSQSVFDQTLVGIIDDPAITVGKITYVDADADNTTTTDKAWELHREFGNQEDVYMANMTGSHTSSSLVTSVGGLSHGTYDVWAYFWSREGEDWRLRGGFTPTDLLVFRRWSSQHAEREHFTQEVDVSEAGMGLYRAYIGRTTVKNGTKIHVYIGEFQGQGNVAYDGVGVAQVTTSE